MHKLKRVVLWIVLLVIILLIVFSIYGAFHGAEKAHHYSNSLPLAIYWLAFTVLLIIGIFSFRNLTNLPALLLIHLGCILILAGSMWGSAAGHEIQNRLFKINKIRKGKMAIREHSSETRVFAFGEEGVKKLPFDVCLDEFRLEYYQPGYLVIFSTEDSQTQQIPAVIGTEQYINDDIGSIEFVRQFENFKIKIDGDQKIAYDDPNSGLNPALEIKIKPPNEPARTKYVFQRFSGMAHPEDTFRLLYNRYVRDYITEIKIVKDANIVAEKDIEVNHPLHFGGYHFYQDSYGIDNGLYTVLAVVSDTGLDTVYAGYALLCAGVFWHFWFRHIFASFKRKKHVTINDSESAHGS